MREGLIQPIQKELEIDEPEAAAAPILPSQSPRATLGRCDPSTDVIVDTMTEDELLRGLERLTPEESMVKGEAAASAGARGSRY
jgi:DNA-directed RNA polymerase subunit omega